MSKVKKIICTGGGTLGSVTPLLAVINELKGRGDFEFEWWGTSDGPEVKIVKDLGINYKIIAAGKLRRYLSMENFKDLGRIVWGFAESLWNFGLAKPAAVLTAGGYVAVPVGYAAYFYDVPLFVHQEDIKPGLANKLLAPIADVITVSFKKSMQDYPSAKTKFVGNPVRSEFLSPPTQEAAQHKLNLAAGKTTILIMGGGTGSEFLNELVKKVLPDLLSKYQIIHLTGLGKNSDYQSLPNYRVEAITTTIIYHMMAADVVISRAGLATISELSALGKPALIIPLFGTHQEANAEYLNKEQAAVVISQPDLTPETLVATLDRLLNSPAQLATLSKNIYSLMPKDSAQLMAQEIIKHT